MIDKDVVRQAYESGEGTFRTLAEKFGVSEGTVKSWAKQDRDKGQPWTKPGKPKAQPKKQKTKTEKVESKKVEVEKAVSWVEIENEYVTDISRKPCTLESLSDKHGVSFSLIAKYAAEKSWSKKRKDYEKAVKEKTIDKTAEKISDNFSDFNASILEVLAIATEKIRTVADNELTLTFTTNEKDELVVKDTELVDTKKLQAVTSSLKTVQDCIFKGFGREQELELKKLELAREKFEFEKAKATGNVEETEDDGFIKALDVVVEDIWNDGTED